jgi:adenylate cyclase
LRISIHVGDVVVQGDDLMGDGVNVAARVEGIAESDGIAITRAMHEQVRDKLDLGFNDKGEIELKNFQRPVQVSLIQGSKVDGQATALQLPDKPSIAVLPFQNIRGGSRLYGRAVRRSVTGN